MNIRINGELADITLQDEKSVGDIVLGVREWLHSKNHALLSVVVDGSPRDVFDQEALDSMTLGGISELAFESSSFYDMELSQLSAIQDFLATLQELAAEVPEKGTVSAELSSAISDFPSLILGISHYFPSNEEGSPVARLTGILQETFHGKKVALQHSGLILSAVQAIQPLVQGRIAEFRDPVGEVDKTLKTLDLLQPDLVNVSTQFQTNRLAEALGTMYRLIELASKLLRCLSVLNTWFPDTIDSGDLSDQVKALNSILNELMTGLEQQDLVLMADILEYELHPIFANLRQLISKAQPEE